MPGKVKQQGPGRVFIGKGQAETMKEKVGNAGATQHDKLDYIIFLLEKLTGEAV